MIKLKHFSKSSRALSLVRSYKSNSDVHGVKPQSNVMEQNKDFIAQSCIKKSNLERVVQAYRDDGFHYALKDPLFMKNRNKENFLSPEELDKLMADENYNVEGILHWSKESKEAPFSVVLKHLEDMYCGNLSLEASQVANKEEKQWLFNAIEDPSFYVMDDKKKKDICKILLECQVFEKFLGTKFPSLKRYSGEGAESLLSFFHELFSSSAKDKVEDILLSNAHRGRLSLLTGLLKYPPSQLFYKIKGNPEFPSKYKFIGDVSSHLTSSVDISYGEDNVQVSMIPNPSHLEASHPVITGKTRSRQLTKGYGHYGHVEDCNKVISVQVHGDAAIAAQGIVMETLILSNLPHFDVGGSIHLIVNNQLGFTTPQEGATTSEHCSDVGKIIGCPIIHVNGDYPEDVAKASKVALEYKRLFKKDIIVNMHCFRRWGHNEIDDPTFTNPAMYKIIHERLTVPDFYKNKLLNDVIISESEVARIESDYTNLLGEELTRSNSLEPTWSVFDGNWKGLQQADDQSTSVWDTGCSIDLLKYVGSKSVDIPKEFHIHPHLHKTHCQARLNKIQDDSNIDWATAESLAIGSLLLEGHHVRICGQDVGRGTFSQRHAMLVDQETEEIYIPLNHMKNEQNTFLEVVNSPLSEEAVLAYEYGMSIENPHHLIIWEAQFGDFFNGAQIIIDTFISSGELKWLLQSGLVMLLPHGMDGTGPDHSSCKLERFLQLSDSKEDSVDGDDVNMQVVNPTTPAQYFHLLRRQQVRTFRKPLIVASPKLILRMSAATSSLSEMNNGTYFKSVLGDTAANNSSVEKVIFCSGKHFYDLNKQRTKLKKENISIIRLESLVPFPAEELKEELAKYTNAKEFLWSQEEQRNQGAWSFVAPRFENLLNIKLSYNGRPVLGTSAIGVGKWHSEESEELIKEF